MMPQEIEDLIQKVSNDVKQEAMRDTVSFQQILASSSHSKKPEDWSTKDFFRYYIDLYERATKQKYLITYASDLSNLKTLKSVFIKHTLDTNKEGFKSFLDWCFENREFIFKDCGNFLLPSLRKYINRYIADTQEADLNLSEENNFLEKLRSRAKKTTRFSDMLKIYGIPIMATYMVKIAGKDENSFMDNMDKIIRTQYERKNISDLRKIAKQSIALSPYPQFFYGMNWRQDFIDIWEDLGIMDEDWWRPSDYSSRPAEHYQELNGV